MAWLRLLLGALLLHAHTALRQEHVLGPLEERVAFDDQLIIWIRGHPVFHPVPLP
jgi:hypothetical protein